MRWPHGACDRVQARSSLFEAARRAGVPPARGASARHRPRPAADQGALVGGNRASFAIDSAVNQGPLVKVVSECAGVGGVG
jgi:hypothetical protein